MKNAAVLLIYCPDRKGIVAAVTQFIFAHGGNIIDLEQHVDAETNVFFMRVEIDAAGLAFPLRDFPARFGRIARSFGMGWELHRADRAMRVAIFVTRESHCLYDLLARHEAGEWNIEIPLIVSNRPDLKAVAARFSIPFRVLPISPETKSAQEKKALALLRAARVDAVVLARYMQILTADFVRHYPNRIINIHHSFLPSFMGAKPYHAAYERGVKIIGATSHYVTADLDTGPIIEQDVVRVSHRDTVEEFIRKGKDVEKVVLARAVAAHVEHRVLVYRNRTVVFS
jgi:formyltetrahydrofolate deformylase